MSFDAEQVAQSSRVRALPRMANAAGSTRGGPKRRAPRIWALRLAVVAMVAAVATIMGALPSPVTVADQARQLQAAHTGSGADTTELSRDCYWSGPCRAGTGAKWWLAGEQLWKALPSRPGVAWSLAAGTIICVESLRPLSSSRWWWRIALVTGEPWRASLSLDWCSLSVLSARRRCWIALRRFPGDVCRSDRLPRAR